VLSRRAQEIWEQFRISGVIYLELLADNNSRGIGAHRSGTELVKAGLLRHMRTRSRRRGGYRACYKLTAKGKRAVIEHWRQLGGH
jgi:hypothetical protein